MATATISCRTPSSYTPESWSDLPEDLLHSILLYLCRVQDLVAFSSVCRSWRCCGRSTISGSTTSLFPPLLILPLLQHHSRRRRRLTVSALQLIDPAQKSYSVPIPAPKTLPRSPIEQSILTLPFISSSHGHVIFLSPHCQILIFNFITGCHITSPDLPIGYDCQSTSLAQLTAPVSSQSCTLILLTVEYLLLWKINSPNWVSHRLPVRLKYMKQMVVVERRIWALELDNTMSLLELPQESCSKLIVMQWPHWRWDTLPGSPDARLVNCEGQVLCVKFSFYADEEESKSKTKVDVFRIELMANNQINFVKKINIENRAFFLSDVVRVLASVCNDPERWGGRRNCVYYARADHKDWYVVEVGHFAPRSFINEANRTTCSFPFWNFASILQ